MIATLRGEITQIEDNALIIEVGGVGMRVFVPTPLRGRMKVGEAVFLYTYLVVRENVKPNSPCTVSNPRLTGTCSITCWA